LGQTPYSRLLAAAALAVAVSAGLLGVQRALDDRRHGHTDGAQWIWLTRLIPKPEPRRFAAERTFSIAGPPATAGVRIFVDRSYVLWVNGERVGQGGQRPGGALDLYDVARLLRAGTNRIVIDAASENGVGGILFVLDFGPGGPAAIVSDERWTVNGTPVIVWGRPPMFPWGYPPMKVVTGAAAVTSAPSASRAAAQ
jgi:hypothetical protein